MKRINGQHLSFAVKLLNRFEESVNIFPTAGGRNITARGNNKIGMAAAFGHNTLCFILDGFRRSVSELQCRVDISHGDNICGNMLQHFLHHIFQLVSTFDGP